MRMQQLVGLTALTLGVALLATGPVTGQGRKSASVVKAKAEAGKIGADGKQTITFTLTVDPKYYIYANPVGNEDFSSNQTSLSITGKNKLESVKVDYPAGEVVKDKVVGDYKIYKGKVTIKATVTRASGDTGALAAVLKVQACTKSSCLEPSKITLSIP